MTITKGKLIGNPAIEFDGDSIISLAHDGSGNALTSTGGALDVNIENASIVVSATDLDIRDLAFATDSVDVSGSAVSITGSVAVTATNLDIRDLAFATDKVDVSGSSNVAVTDGGGSLTVDGTVAVSSVGGTVTVAATDLDIRDLAFATDSVDVSGSSVSISGSVVVTATNLDIRDLSASSDSVRIGDGTDFLAVNADGSINVAGTFTIDGQYAEDSAHVSGNVGLYNLAVRSDAPAVATSADGDYASQTVDAYNRSWVNTGSNVSIAVGAVGVTTTSGLLVAASAGRRTIRVVNVGSKEVYFGPSGVSTSTGWPIPAGASDEFEIGPGLALHAVALSGTQSVRYMQLA